MDFALNREISDVGYNNYPRKIPDKTEIKYIPVSDLCLDLLSKKETNRLKKDFIAMGDLNHILIVAGNLCKGFNLEALNWLVDIAPAYYRVFYTLGPYEYYGENVSIFANDDYVKKYIKFFERTNVIFLHNIPQDLHGVSYIGNALFSKVEIDSLLYLYANVDDFIKIRTENNQDLDIIRFNKINNSFILRLIKNFDNAKFPVVFVTGFAPTLDTIGSRKDLLYKEYYANNDDRLNTLLLSPKTLRWFHGNSKDTLTSDKIATNGYYKNLNFNLGPL